ncbi:MAG: ribose-5-phosphate isomerase RpiA [Gammaproteobacteria bacterium]|jgi:ribose 5-phosphate isomerase A|nr:ribose-5-phosphate isomerase RpiA [Gammaproteobacteria bacterium]MBL6819260.1 ribose-5-phosphate isomerase RpiA [Gammaproteobacteria bacterium]MBL6898439.1 ribose-5-phosphate isomerase RpiA [Gammaproteobacteria bacterium]
MDQITKKHKVAESVLDLIDNDEILGIGSGSTVNILIEYLPKVKNKISRVVSSSLKSTELLKANGFEVVDLKSVGKLSKYVDGADEINKYLQMIKGGGGALTREKILAHNSNRFICIVDDSKKVSVLGTFPLPIEVIPIAQSAVALEVIKMGGRPVLRENFTTDNGNIILDVHNFMISEPLKLEKKINNIPGVVTNGIFALNHADMLLSASDDGVNLSEPIV